MSVTARQLNRATLQRQMLLHREPVPVVDAVRRVVALQAQEAASPYVALWNRLSPFDPAELDAAFAVRAVVKATLMRITLHAVHAGDYPLLHDAMLPTLRGARLNDRRFRSTGLSVDEADELVPHLVDLAATPRTGADLEAALAARLGGAADRGVWWALRTFAPLVHVPAGTPWSFGQRPSYVAPGSEPLQDPEGSVRRLVLRFLEGFGPATAQDVAQFTMLRRGPVRDALQGLAESVVRMPGPGGAELFDVVGGSLPQEDVAAPPRLMAMWDSVLLAYADRSRIVPAQYRPLVIRSNGDVLPAVLVDGYVAGVWRPGAGGIEVTAFERLSDEAWRGLAVESVALAAFLADRDPTVYRRYAHWWSTLPSAERRTLPA